MRHCRIAPEHPCLCRENGHDNETNLMRQNEGKLQFVRDRRDGLRVATTRNQPQRWRSLRGGPASSECPGRGYKCAQDRHLGWERRIRRCQYGSTMMVFVCAVRHDSGESCTDSTPPIVYTSMISLYFPKYFRQHRIYSLFRLNVLQPLSSHVILIGEKHRGPHHRA